MKRRDFAREVLRRLKKRYPKPGPFARWKTRLQLVVVTMLSAQCTDSRVNLISGKLFRRYGSAKDFAEARVCDLEKMIYSTGYYKSKARYLKGIGEILISQFGGKVPEAFDDLVKLPGISKKSACIIAAKGFGKMYGVAVDTHVARVAPRLGLAQSRTRDGIAAELEKIFPSEEYLHVNELMIMAGRDVCTPGIPRCDRCVLNDICPKKFTKGKKV